MGTKIRDEFLELERCDQERGCRCVLYDVDGPICGGTAMNNFYESLYVLGVYTDEAVVATNMEIAGEIALEQHKALELGSARIDKESSFEHLNTKRNFHIGKLLLSLT